ncbi:MAG TPA: lmo0937 family membrane protein [Ktedonosporobacter sp.]|nr:lmo0937 family membrane protein [Ktedonosporobacter sp.]
MGNILWTIVVVLVVLWLIGFVAHFAGGLIHLLLVLALIVLVWNLIMRSRANRPL